MEAEEYRRRVAVLAAWNEPLDRWRDRSAEDVAFTLEGLGVSPNDFSRVLRLADTVTPHFTPAALADVSAWYRVGVARLREANRFSGVPIGAYGGCAVLVWTKTETDFRNPS